MSQRTARLDELLREEISASSRREVDDPRIGFVTVTDVEARPTCATRRSGSASSAPDERDRKHAALGRAMPFVRHALGPSCA